MQDNQYKVLDEVLQKYDNEGLLKNIVIIGSWCIYFYKYYFKNIDYKSSGRTTDIDLLIINS